MSPQKPARLSRLSRLINFMLFRALPVVLIAASVLVGIQILGALFDRVGSQAQIEARRPLYAATATAIAALDRSGLRLPDGMRVAFKPARAIQSAVRRDTVRQMVTATPVMQAVPIDPLLPLATPGTPRPLPTFYIYEDPAAFGEGGGTAIPTPVASLDRFGNDLMNIALLGHDGELTEDGFIRTDTMIIVSINRTTGTVSMITLPRDLYVYIPDWTMQRINLTYIHGENAGWTDGGFGLLRQTLFYNFGINIHYFAMVNMTGFKAIVDTVGGVELTVDCAIEDLPLIGAEVPSGAYRVNEEGYRVLPVGAYTLNGAEALWYVRSRHNSSDFDRGRRQQQLLRAVWRKARENGLLNNIIPLWNETTQFVETNMTLEDVLGLAPLALSIDSSQIENYRLVRTYHTTPWQPPDGSNVQLPVAETMRQLMQDFYTPPTENQLVFRRSAIEVYDGSGNADWDRVAAERLAWDGFGALAMGDAPGGEVSDETILIDYTGRSKGSSLNAIAALLNVLPENVRVEPSAERSADFAVIIGRNYNSCVEDGIIAATG
ncbi:MAG: LCP family protein [Chloroflexota bacterium]|nr:LCP family protein [Chloroflexota bacterium]